jgi:hypothetical protein
MCQTQGNVLTKENSIEYNLTNNLTFEAKNPVFVHVPRQVSGCKIKLNLFSTCLQHSLCLLLHMQDMEATLQSDNAIELSVCGVKADTVRTVRLMYQYTNMQPMLTHVFTTVGIANC